MPLDGGARARGRSSGWLEFVAPLGWQGLLESRMSRAPRAGVRSGRPPRVSGAPRVSLQLTRRLLERVLGTWRVPPRRTPSSRSRPLGRISSFAAHGARRSPRGSHCARPAPHSDRAVPPTLRAARYRSGPARAGSTVRPSLPVRRRGSHSRRSFRPAHASPVHSARTAPACPRIARPDGRRRGHALTATARGTVGGGGAEVGGRRWVLASYQSENDQSSALALVTDRGTGRIIEHVSYVCGTVRANEKPMGDR